MLRTLLSTCTQVSCTRKTIQAFTLSSRLQQQRFESTSSTHKIPFVRIDRLPTEKTSFWNDFVHYPWPVHTVSLSGGWNLAYMDVPPSSGQQPKGTLVLVHGKGANAGHYSNVIDTLASAGYRVIAPDLPHYGKSLPINLHRPLTRTMADCRRLVHELLVEHLKLKQPVHLYGHSLGGLFALGFYLDWPEIVRSLVLEAPAGLEEFTSQVINKQFSASMKDDVEEWLRVWRSNVNAEYRKSIADIEDFYEWRSFSIVRSTQLTNGIAVGYGAADMGYFVRPTEPCARFLTDARKLLSVAAGLPQAIQCQREHLQWCSIYVRDVYSIGIEVAVEDAQSVSKRAVTQIRVPTALLFGEKEPFIPGPAMSGLTNLRQQVVEPFVSRLRANTQAQVHVKFYGNAGHFPHTDAPQFAGDVVEFLNAH